jgi:hypothetical protein
MSDKNYDYAFGRASEGAQNMYSALTAKTVTDIIPKQSKSLWSFAAYCSHVK